MFSKLPHPSGLHGSVVWSMVSRTALLSSAIGKGGRDDPPRFKYNPNPRLEYCNFLDCSIPPNIATFETLQPIASMSNAPVALPRVVIRYCVQCKWGLRAAYFAQELLSTFGTSIGEVALTPATGGLFQVQLTYAEPAATSEGDASAAANVKELLIWDRKAEGGFPETKILKQKVRDLIEPGKGLGHSDMPSTAKAKDEAEAKKEEPVTANVGGETAGGEAAAPGTEALSEDSKAECEDCK